MLAILIFPIDFRTLPRPADGKIYKAGDVKKPFWVVNRCNGNESSVAECGFVDIKNDSRCEEVYDHTIAGVDCDPSKFRV